jgi:hypothetical protein
MYTTLTILTILILTAAWNGQVINWKQSVYLFEHKKWSKRWHRTGFIIRALLFIPIILSGQLWPIFAYLFLSYPVYNAIINIYLDQPLFYIGATAWIDRKIPHELQYTIYLFLAIATIYTAIDPQLNIIEQAYQFILRLI